MITRDTAIEILDILATGSLRYTEGGLECIMENARNVVNGLSRLEDILSIKEIVTFPQSHKNVAKSVLTVKSIMTDVLKEIAPVLGLDKVSSSKRNYDMVTDKGSIYLISLTGVVKFGDSTIKEMLFDGASIKFVSNEYNIAVSSKLGTNLNNSIPSFTEAMFKHLRSYKYEDRSFFSNPVVETTLRMICLSLNSKGSLDKTIGELGERFDLIKEYSAIFDYVSNSSNPLNIAKELVMGTQGDGYVIDFNDRFKNVDRKLFEDAFGLKITRVDLVVANPSTSGTFYNLNAVTGRLGSAVLSDVPTLDYILGTHTVDLTDSGEIVLDTSSGSRIDVKRVTGELIWEIHPDMGRELRSEDILRSLEEVNVDFSVRDLLDLLRELVSFDLIVVEDMVSAMSNYLEYRRNKTKPQTGNVKTDTNLIEKDTVDTKEGIVFKPMPDIHILPQLKIGVMSTGEVYEARPNNQGVLGYTIPNLFGVEDNDVTIPLTVITDYLWEEARRDK